MFDPQSILVQGADLANIGDPVPRDWKHRNACLECSLHQLSPYIGKLQAGIARELVTRFSTRGDLVLDPFAGSGTVPLEAVLHDRNVFASDLSPYARVLTVGKIRAPQCLFQALDEFEVAFDESKRLPEPDLRSVPQWVRSFFHPKTLKETINFSIVCRRTQREFLLACLLGVLHHQRPGFLSFPSSHLVPYLRDKKFPRDHFSELYTYRALRPRLVAKLERTFRRLSEEPRGRLLDFQERSIKQAQFPKRIDAIITSPPYMNALDYGRDNRLRLWFIDPQTDWQRQEKPTARRTAFVEAIRALATVAETRLKQSGYCVLVVGEETRRKGTKHPSQEVMKVFVEAARSLKLADVFTDQIPDVRRSRRECHGVRSEHILIFKKSK